MPEYVRLKRENSIAQTRIAELEKDAARYRLARDHNHGVCFWTEFAKPLWMYEQAADGALDAALKSRP